MRDPVTRKSRRLFRPWEADEIKNNKRTLQKALESPHIEDKSAVRDAIGRLNSMEREHGVPDFTPAERDKAAKRVKELEGQIQEGMLSHEEMRRNPPGAVDQNVWWERKNKKRIGLWRDLNMALHKGIPADQAQSLTSVERLRPRANRLNMDNAQIPAARSFSFPSEAYSENYDSIFKPKAPEEPTPLDEPEEISQTDALLEDAEAVQDRPETARALGVLAKGRRAASA
jgi:hypothetical protein